MNSLSFAVAKGTRTLNRTTRARARQTAVLEALEPRTLLSTTTLVSSATDGSAAGNADLLLPGSAMNYSPDGRFALFTSQSTNLVAGVTDTNNAMDIFLRDFQNNTTTIISANDTGQALGSSAISNLTFSPDSHYLMFTTSAANMVAGVADTNGKTDLFVRDLPAGTTSVVSVNDTGTSTGNEGVVGAPLFSPDSRYVAFTSQASDMINGVADTTGEDVFVRDLQADTTSCISIAASGASTGESVSDGPLVFSPDGRYLAFNSQATNLVNGVTGIDGTNLYVRDRQTNTTYIVTRDVNNDATGWAASSDPFQYGFTPDSQTLIYTSNGTNVVAGVTDSIQGNQILAWNSSSNTISMLSVDPTGTAADNKPSDIMGLSADGRYLAFTSASTNLTAQSADGDLKADLYVRDLQTGITSYVAVNATNSVAFPTPEFSPNSKYLLFDSDATNVVPGIADTNGNTDLFLYDLSSTVVSPLTINDTGTAMANTDTTGVAIPTFSPDGQYLFFASDATDLTPHVTSNHELINLYVRDLQTGTTTLVSASLTGADAGFNPNTQQAAFTADSKYIVFEDDGMIANSITTIQNFVFNSVSLYAMDLTTNTGYLLGANAAQTAPSNGSVSEFTVDPATDAALFVSTSSDMVNGVTDTTTNSTTGRDVFVATISPSAAATGSAHASVTGLGVAIASGDGTPSATDGTAFGSTPVGTTVSRTFTVSNSGSAALTTSNLTLPGGYTLTEPLDASVAAGQSDSFTVRFDAASAGTYTGTVSFATNDTAASTYSFAVSASATVVVAGPAPDFDIEGGVTGVKLGTFVGGSKGGRATVKVFNRGNETASGNIQVTFYASADGTVDVGDKPLATVTHKTKLGINKSLLFTGTFAYPVGIPNGTYFILAEVDPANTFAESNETNNVASSPAAITVQAPFVDLFGVSLATVGKFQAGKHGSAALIFQNGGNVTATGTITIELVVSADDTLGNGDDVVAKSLVIHLALPKGAKRRVALLGNLAGIVAGPYHVFAVIDSTNAVTESNEANNTIEDAALVSVV